MIEEKSWQEFQKTGLVLFINQILHVFGWAIVFQFNDTTKEFERVFPARCKFRGFDEKSVSESYTKITEYMSDNISELKKDVKD